MTHPIMFDDDTPGLARLREICLSYPGAEERISHGRPTFRTTSKIFAAFGGSEKIRPGEHRPVPSALIFFADGAERPAYDEDERFFVPAYYGPYGYRAIDLAAEPDWSEVSELIDASYRLTAPQRLLRALDDQAPA